MTREDTRRAKARELARGLEGGQSEFARILSMDSSQVSQIIGKTPTKNIGNSIARRIEKAFEKPAGWLDNDNDARPALTAPVVHIVPETDLGFDPAQLRQWIEIFIDLDHAGRESLISAGHGLVSAAKSSSARNKR